MTIRRPWLIYACSVLTLWVLIPELRRVADWRIGGGISSILPLLPLVSMLPALTVLRKWVNGLSSFVLFAMMASLSYACLIGIASGNGLEPVLYTFADFALPLIFGGWLAQRAVDDPDGFSRFVRIALWLLAATSAYGIFVYVTLPPWEALWLNAGPSSTGAAAPFGFRVFGTMNSPGIFATFLVLVLTLNFAELAKRRPLDLLAGAVCFAALALSLVRSAWAALAIAIVVYLLLSPARLRTFGALLAIVLTIAIPVGIFIGGSDGNPALANVVNRIGTLGDLGNDDSAVNRSSQIGDALVAASNAPQGLGLGVFGAVTKLSTVNGDVAYLDSGYLARFVELGIFGSLAMALALGVSVACGIACVFARKADSIGRMPFYCAMFSAQAAMIWFNFSGDLMRAGPGWLFWAATFVLIGAVDRANQSVAVERLHNAVLGARG